MLLCMFPVYILSGLYTGDNQILLTAQRMIGGASGVIVLVAICEKIGSLPYISYVGRYSIILLVTHEPLIRILSTMQISIPVMIPLILTSYLIIIPLMIKLLPHVTAQKPVISRGK